MQLKYVWRLIERFIAQAVVQCHGQAVNPAAQAPLLGGDNAPHYSYKPLMNKYCTS